MTSTAAGAPTAPEAARGRTQISPAVVQKIVGTTAREAWGIASLGAGAARAVGALRERLSGGSSTAVTAGVQVEVGETQAAIDLDVVVEYGASVVDVARSLRSDILASVERLTGLEVVEVNIAVNDIRLPDPDDGPRASTPTPTRSPGRVA